MSNMPITERKIDIVMCIDATSSMGPCIDNVRNHAKSFYREVVNKMQTEYASTVTELRIQVITFRDLECDVDAIQQSEFFELPSDTDLFERYLNSITPRGGGDYKESGLEALYTAMTTKWTARGAKDRQVIVLFTDADAIGFDEKRNRTGYPNECDESTFLMTWNCQRGNLNTLTDRSKRLLMYAPDNTKYSEIVRYMKRSIHRSVVPQNGMADVGFDDIIKMLCASASSN